jgi:hypothetical protein
MLMTDRLPNHISLLNEPTEASQPGSRLTLFHVLHLGVFLAVWALMLPEGARRFGIVEGMIGVILGLAVGRLCGSLVLPSASAIYLSAFYTRRAARWIFSRREADSDRENG